MTVRSSIFPALAAVALAVFLGGAAPAGEAASDSLRPLLLIGAFVMALIVFVWIASRVMGNPNPPLDEDPFFPIGIDDDKDVD